jgi:hypothetical protein
MNHPLAISLFLAIAWQQGDVGKRRGRFFFLHPTAASSCRRASPPGGARLLSERARAREWFKLSMVVYSK